MKFDIVTIPREEYLELQIEEYKRIMFKYRDHIVRLRTERDEALERLEQIKALDKDVDLN